jgi:segregation and condensation protein B
MNHEQDPPYDPKSDAERAAAQGTADAEATQTSAELPHPAPATLDYEQLSRVAEALLLASDAPLTLEQLVKLVAVDFPVAKRDLRLALERLEQRMGGSAAELVEVAGGWRIQVRAAYAEIVSRLWQEKPPKLTRALLETLALICYRQPITRGEIEDVRGVAVSSNILKTLLERGWIREVGVRETPGRPSLYGTTSQLLDDLNLRTLDQLPALPDVKDLEQLEAALARLAEAGTGASAASAEVSAETVSGLSEPGDEGNPSHTLH